MSIDRWRYELQIMGLRVILPPFLLLVAFALLAFLLHFLGVDPAHFLSAGLEMFLPVAIGVIVATSCIQDPALELQLTMPKAYANTVLRRLSFIVGWSALSAFIASTIIALLQLEYLPDQIRNWAVPLRFIVSQLIWLAPLLWFVTVGLCTALLTHSRSACAALLGGIWIIEALFLNNIVATNTWLQPFMLFPSTLVASIPFWLTNRLEVLAMALLLLPISWFLLHKTEGLLKGSNEE